MNPNPYANIPPYFVLGFEAHSVACEKALMLPEKASVPVLDCTLFSFLVYLLLGGIQKSLDLKQADAWQI